MLQQTQVATVIGYFKRFLKEFPTVRVLAAAPLSAVLRLWEGLGYYRRARHLHQAARRIVTEHHGRIPHEPDLLQGLPGFGRYTVGAVLSQAFDMRLPVLEANSRRVLCRLLGFAGDPRRAPGQDQLWQAAEDVLPQRGAGDFNQALMELGALICSPKTPACSTCPVCRWCVARRQGIQDVTPTRDRAPSVKAVHEAAVVVWRNGRVLLVQRPDHGRWAELWEFPHGPVRPSESSPAAASRILRDLGLSATLGPVLTTVRHGIMRERVSMVCFEARLRRGECRSDYYVGTRWTQLREMADFPMSAPQRRIAETLGRNDQGAKRSRSQPPAGSRR